MNYKLIDGIWRIRITDDKDLKGVVTHTIKDGVEFKINDKEILSIYNLNCENFQSQSRKFKPDTFLVVEATKGNAALFVLDIISIENPMEEYHGLTDENKWFVICDGKHLMIKIRFMPFFNKLKKIFN